jgi:PKD repeat protein
MRSAHLLALAAAIAAAGTACGGDNGGNGPSNDPPVANFGEPTCTLLSCTFTDASTDDGTIASRSWAFENGTPATSTEATQAVTFSAAGTHTVTLTVTDNEGASDDFSREVTVSTTAPANQPPVADFNAACSSQNCDFTNSSTDADGSITTFAWDFGEPASADNTSAEEDPSHAYAAPGDFTVTLTVTDDDGATTSVTKTINVAPPATLTCGTDPNCDLTLSAAAKVTVTLISEDCEVSGNTFKVVITSPGEAPVEETLFTDGCNEPTGVPIDLQTSATFVAGTTIQAQVISGGGTLVSPPALRLTPESAYPSWTLEFDDGVFADPGGPDFNDLKLTIVATPQ